VVVLAQTVGAVILLALESLKAVVVQQINQIQALLLAAHLLVLAVEMVALAV
jgi:hypothetical protein